MKEIIAWTRQIDKVLDEINSTGRYTVKEEYVREKNKEISDYYIELYKWYTENCRRYIHIDKDLYFPIWLALTENQKLPPSKGDVSLTLSIPEENVFIIDYDKWGYRLNHLYIPDNEKDEEEHLKMLKSYGISNESSILMTNKGNFYPLIKQKIIKSFDKLFTQPNDNMDNNVGTIWEIKKEWIKDIEKY